MIKQFIKKLIPQSVLKLRYDFLLNRQRRRFGRHCEELLLKVGEILDEEGITYWLNYGTLLGAYRDNAFIPHDYDMDLGVYLEDYARIVPLMEKHGLKLKDHYRFNSWENPENYAYRFEWKGVYLDFNFYIREGNMVHTYLPLFLPDESYGPGCHAKVLAEYNEYPFTGVKSMPFLGKMFSVPENTEEFLIANYGPDYMTPIKDFDYHDVVKGLVEYSFEDKPSYIEIY